MMEKPEEVVGLDYWMKWQVPVCALIIAIPAAISINITKKKTKTAKPLNFNDLWVPCWRKLDPKWLLLYRAFAFLSMAWFLYHMVLFAGFFAFYFYTQWTFVLVMVYFAVGIIMSARGCMMPCEKAQTEVGDKDTSPKNETDDTRAGFLGYLMQTIYQISAGASVLTDLVFWCVLVPMMAGKQFEVTFVIGGIHSLNAIFLIIDSLLNALPFQWLGFTYFVLWGATYVTFLWIVRACGSAWWPYPFLELSTPQAPLWYLGLALIHIPCYGVYILLVKAKESIFSKLFPGVFVRSHRGSSQGKKAT